MRKKVFFAVIICFSLLPGWLAAQHSAAREWNERVLYAIENDFARPTVHARNLFHTSAAMYDAWAVYDSLADTYLLGRSQHGFVWPLGSFPWPEDVEAAREEAISYAVYRLIRHRFQNSPNVEDIFAVIDLLMRQKGYDPGNASTDYRCGPAEMGNYIAAGYIQYGLQDGANEADGYANRYYKPVNPPMTVSVPGGGNVVDINRWQPLQLQQIVDQSGNPLPGNVQGFLSPEWGSVLPFSLQPEDAVTYQRDGHNYVVYHDPGPPALMGQGLDPESEAFRWNHLLVAVWSSHLDPADGVMWDVSPASLGNIQTYPTQWSEYPDFYDLFEGGDTGMGYALNPKTGQPYAPQIVPRGDYARVLAEFWADGPNSVTPPGHWFDILNYVHDHPEFRRRLRGQGPELDPLEWDVKAYFALGGAMHDVAISTWGIKGWYDSSRPITAIRAMAERGQCSNPQLPNYHPQGLPLIPDYVELIAAGDSLAGPEGQHIGEVKILAWKGTTRISRPATQTAGVGWVRAREWLPYQRPTFVTPPFAGYTSGHSTYSRAAAELLTALTGDPFFPGGMGEFSCPKNEFLVFEDGPSTDVILQWATYRDASDQCSLSRIWGSIHPPIDDIPGRHIGTIIGPNALAFAERFFVREARNPEPVAEARAFPVPTHCWLEIEFPHEGPLYTQVYALDGRLAREVQLEFVRDRALLSLEGLPAGLYVLVGRDGTGKRLFEQKVVRTD